MSRALQICDSFLEFHRKNPGIWELFERFTLHLIKSGRKRYSASAIVERVRWEVDVVTVGSGELKLNNNFVAYYARLFEITYPEYQGFFGLRKLVSAEKQPFAVEFSPVDTGPRGDEDEIRWRLLTRARTP